MKRLVTVRFFLATLFCLLGAVPAYSQDRSSGNPFESRQSGIDALIRRLDRQEREIQELRSQVEESAAAGRDNSRLDSSESDYDYQEAEKEVEVDSRLSAMENILNGSTPPPNWTSVFSNASDSLYVSEQGGSLADRVLNLEKSQAVDPTKPTLEINGRIHLDHWSFADDSEGIHNFENPGTGVDPEDRFFFRRIRLKFQGDVYENVLYRMQIDFNSPDSGEMKDMYIGFKSVPFFQRILIGNQKRPMGLDHLNSSRFNIFIERPMVVEAFNEDARRVGIAAYGVSDDEVYNWRYGVYAMENMVTDGEIIGDSRQWSLNGRIASTPWYECDGRNYFHWAIAGMVARPDGDADPNDTNANEGRFRTRAELRSNRRWIDTGRIAGAENYEILAVESVLNVGALQFVGEYQSSWMQRDSTTAGTGPDLNFHGGYVYLAYMLTGEHVPFSRSKGTIGRVKPYRNFSFYDRCCGGEAKGWGAWQVALRYSYLDLTDADILGGVENNLTFGLVWYMNPNTSMQFNAVYGDIDDHAPTGGFTDGHFTALGTRLRVDF